MSKFVGFRRFLFLTVIISSCAAPSVEILLTEQQFQSGDGVLKGRVPQGWFASPDHQIAPHLSAWLIREDYAANLTFQEIRVDRTTMTQIEKQGLILLAEISFRLKKAEEPTARMKMPPNEFSINEKKFCRYEYRSEKQGLVTGVVVFSIRGRCFESVVVPTPSGGSLQQPQQLFNVQEAVLSSLQP